MARDNAEGRKRKQSLSALIFYAACAVFGTILGAIDLPTLAKIEFMLPPRVFSLSRFAQQSADWFELLTMFYAHFNLGLLAFLLSRGKVFASLALAVTFFAAFFSMFLQDLASSALRASESGGVFPRFEWLGVFQRAIHHVFIVALLAFAVVMISRAVVFATKSVLRTSSTRSRNV